MNILIVEDLEDSRYLLLKILQGNGYKVTAATNGQEALQRLRADRFDLIISDILMPVMDGYRLCYAVKADKKLQTIPFVFYSGTFDSSEDERLAMQAGASLFIRKPIDPEAFIALIQGVTQGLERGEIPPFLPKTDAEEVFNLYDERLVRTLVDRTQALKAELEENQRIQLELRELTIAIEQSPVSVVITDLDANIVYANPCFTRVTGYSSDELIGQNPRILQSKLTPKETYRQMWQTLTNGQAWQGTVINKRKNGELYWEEAHIAPVFDAKGKPSSYVGVKLDITEKKRAQEAVQRINRNFQDLLDAASEVSIIATDVAGLITLFNKGAERMLGYRADEMVGKQTPVCIHLAEQVEAHGRELSKKFGCPISGFPVFVVNAEREGQEQREWIYVRKDGSQLWVALVVTAVRSGQEVTGYLGIAQDITQRKQAEEALQLASLVYQHTSEAMMIADADNRIIAINPAFTQMTGYTPEEVIGKNPCILSSGNEPPELYRAMWEELETNGHWQGEICNRRKNGDLYVEWMTINSICTEDGTLHRRVALFSDITKKKENEELIWRQANFDSLTDLPNRQMFYDCLQREIKQAQRHHSVLALLFLDLDRFKEVNDTLGHSHGDQLLQIAAQRIVSCVRETDIVARLGGDEFTVILSNLDEPDGAERVTRHILQKLAEPYQLQNNLAHVSSSIGLTIFPKDASDAETLLKNADQAMYAAKAAGRNRFSYFTPCMQEATNARMRLENDLRFAMAENQLFLHYQPIVDLATGAIQKAEALLRWQHPSMGLISPATFIPIAEETGLIITIGDWVFRQVIEQLAAWKTSLQLDLQISVNKSPVQFACNADLHRHGKWFEYMQQLGLSGESLVVEITEGLLLDANPAVGERLLAFRNANIAVSIDDFGTGYSSLSYLKKFHIDFLKIDQSFTRNLTPDSDDFVLCEAIIVMAHKLGIKVVAEGVETTQQRDLLRAANCDYAQGYLFSRPIPAAEFESLLMQNSAHTIF